VRTWCAVGVGVIAAEVDGKYTEACVGKDGGLLLPTLFVEASAVSEDKCTRSVAIEVGLDLRGFAGGWIGHGNGNLALCKKRDGQRAEEK